MITNRMKYIVTRFKIPHYSKFDWTTEIDGLEAIPSKLPSLLTVTTPNGTYFVKREWCRKIRVNDKVLAFDRRLH